MRTHLQPTSHATCTNAKSTCVRVVKVPRCALHGVHVLRAVMFTRDLICAQSSSSITRSSHVCWAGDSSGANANSDKQQQQQQQHQVNEEKQQGNASETDTTINTEYIRQQSIRIQALEAYQQLMDQYPDSSSSSSGGVNPQQHHQSDSAPGIPILDAALLIAKHAYPDLDPQHVKQQLDDLAAEVSAALPADIRYPLRVIKEINRVLYDSHGFRGNEQDYYNPDNSYINKVLETKLGIPISLSIIYMEVAARLDLPMAGVNLPAHFMIRPQVEGMEWLVDAFHHGEMTALEDAEEVLSRLMGARVQLDPRFVKGDTPYYSSRHLLLRLLNNLRQIYMGLDMYQDAVWILKFMRATAPKGRLPELQREEGMCLYHLGRYQEAADELTEYLRVSDWQEDIREVVAVLEKIQQQNLGSRNAQQQS